MGFSTSKVKKPQKKEQKKKSLTSDFGKFYELVMVFIKQNIPYILKINSLSDTGFENIFPILYIAF